MNELTFDQLPNAVSELFNKLENIEKLLTEKTEQPPTQPQDELLNVQQAAKLLQLTVPTIYTKVSRNELPFMKRSKRLYFSRLELLAYLKQGCGKTNAEIAAKADTYLSNHKKGSKL